MLTCFFVRRRFTDYMDGALSGREAARVARHLRRCRRCARLFSDVAAVVKASCLRRAPAADEAFWKRFDGELEHKLSERIKASVASVRQPFFGRLALLPRPALVAVSLAVVILTVGLRLSPYGRTMLSVTPTEDPAAALSEELAMLEEVSQENGAGHEAQDDDASELEMLYLLDPASVG